MNRYLPPAHRDSIDVGQIWKGKPNTMYRETAMRIVIVNDDHILGENPANPLSDQPADGYTSLFPYWCLLKWFDRYE